MSRGVETCYRCMGSHPDPPVCACRWSVRLVDRSFVQLMVGDAQLDHDLSQLLVLFV